MTARRTVSAFLNLPARTSAGIVVLIFAIISPGLAAPPKMLLQGPAVHDSQAPSGSRTGFAILRLPDGSFAFYDQNQPSAKPLTLPDRQGETHVLRPSLPDDIAGSEAIQKSGTLTNAQVNLTPERELVSVFVKSQALDRATARQVGLPLYLDVWARRATLEKAFPPQMVWHGYNGSQMEYQQLDGGRILVPYGSMQPHTKPVPPTGRHKTIIQYSDDGGRTWKESESKLTSPCYAGFNGSNEGACEPALEPLKDGRIWMLMRTQAGFLYESFSQDQGTTWSKAAASRFNTSTGPANILRHKNGWLVVCWNNCELPPRHEGQGVYGGRDALHIAVSDDDGRTWRGFREIYLDHRRNENPASNGDRGTAYPLGAFDAEGRIVVLAGQGAGGRNPILIDPKWVVQTEASDDFSEGLEHWSVYKHHGPAKRWWQARAVGCRLMPHPTEANTRCLHVRKPDELPGDGAVWNFPNAWKGTLTALVMLRPGFQGGAISLNDRFFDPANDLGEQLAVFHLDLPSDGQVGQQHLAPGQWHDIQFQWNLSKSECLISVDGVPAGRTPLRHKTLNGLSYLRFRSTSQDIDQAGFLVERVKVSIDDPYAPPCTAADQREHERRYVENVVSHWR